MYKEIVEVKVDYEHGFLLPQIYKDHTKGFIDVEFFKVGGCVDYSHGEKRRCIIMRESDGKYFEYEVVCKTEGLQRSNNIRCFGNGYVNAKEVERKVKLVEEVYYE